MEAVRLVLGTNSILRASTAILLLPNQLSHCIHRTELHHHNSLTTCTTKMGTAPTSKLLPLKLCPSAATRLRDGQGQDRRAPHVRSRIKLRVPDWSHGTFSGVGGALSNAFFTLRCTFRMVYIVRGALSISEGLRWFATVACLECLAAAV